MEKLEKQVNEAEVERLVARWFTKKTAIGLLGGIALLYIWFTTRVQHPQLPQGPAPASFVMPAPVPKVLPPTVPEPVVIDRPRAADVYTQQQSPTSASVEDPKKKLADEHLQKEHESAFASMLTPDEKKFAPDLRPEQSLAPTLASSAPVPTPTPAGSDGAYVIPQGTNATLSLDSRIESERGGPMDAHFVRDVYLPGTRTLVIPRGSKVIGETTAVGALNQRRVAVSFSKIQRDPVDRACDISLTAPALDEAGASGLTGKVSTHIGSTLLGSSLAAVLQGASMGVMYSGGGYGPTQVIIGSTANGAAQTTTRLLDRFIKLPTITVYEGSLADFPFTKDTPVTSCGGLG